MSPFGEVNLGLSKLAIDCEVQPGSAPCCAEGLRSCENIRKSRFFGLQVIENKQAKNRKINNFRASAPFRAEIFILTGPEAEPPAR
jgi:hypothetical protein